MSQDDHEVHHTDGHEHSLSSSEVEEVQPIPGVARISGGGTGVIVGVAGCSATAMEVLARSETAATNKNLGMLGIANSILFLFF